MNRILSVVLTLSLAGAVRAADESKPNTLTPKEVADGWILLFDGETTLGWKIDGSAEASDGVLTFNGKKSQCLAETTSQFAAFELRFEYRLSYDPAAKNHPHLYVGPRMSAAELYSTKKEWYPVVLQVTPSRLHSTIKVPGATPIETTIEFRDPNVGANFLRFKLPESAVLAVRDVKLKPQGLRSVFNGKDLTGWKKYTGDEKRAKTEFSVNKDGELTLKSGPGDLQTEGRYADFILQIESKTNGKHLNSGVFFRCIPGDYQNGYEAQIHNGWDANKEKEYTIDEYDPKTNEPKGKQKIKSHALDYGTGAIYRRIPARKEVAKDNEWFTMTIIAEGRHLATWVNGIQVVDWTDNRPLKDNPRNGCRLEKGPISLQGHDPTTNLNFRNIRIAELKSN
jgi:hypothetical protein